MNILSKILPLLVAVILLGEHATAAAPIRVTCVGASDVSTPTVYGTPNYPVYLAGLLGYGYEVINCGASGTTMMKNGNAPYWNTQQYTDSMNSSPDIVIIMLGSNDSKPENWSHSQDYKPAYLDLIARYRALPTHPRVYLNTLLTVYGSGNYDITDPIVTGEIVPIIKQIGQETNCPVFDINAATKNMPQNFPDNVHPNIEGAKVVAQTTFNGLMSVGEPAPLINLAANRPVSASSVADNSPAANAVDGDFGTRWSSNYTNNEWIAVDLGTATSFTDVYLNWEAAYGPAYKIQVSNDSANWSDIFSTTTGDGGIDRINAPATARYVRMLGVQRATNYGYSLYDFAVVNAGSNTIPSPWTAVDIGAVTPAGSSTFAPNSGAFTIAGAGADIWNSSDAFRYVYQAASGDTLIRARVAAQQAVTGWSKSGVMIRASTAADSAHVSVFITPSNGVAFQYRSTAGGSSTNLNLGGGITAPCWLQVARSGNTFAASYSTNGVNWTSIGSPVTVSMPTNVLSGLAVTSQSNGTLGTSTFDSIGTQAIGGTLRLLNQQSGKALDNAGSINTGTSVTQWANNIGNINQQWTITPLNNGYFKLVCMRSGMALDNAGSTAPNTAITQWTDQATTNSNQQWAIIYTGSGFYKLICRASNMALDNGGSTMDGALVKQAVSSSGATTQSWSFQAP